jgi:uncharacterized protein
MIECAIGIFVKTPGLSPIKTRLARGIGALRAAEFYELSVAAVSSAARETKLRSVKVIPYWAIAEESGLSDQRWREFRRISQGHGDLGDRLSTIYTRLHEAHQNVVLIGADSPQISAATLSDLIANLSAQGGGRVADRNILGRCEDLARYRIRWRSSVHRAQNPLRTFWQVRGGSWVIRCG